MIQGKIIKSLRDKGFGGLLPKGVLWLFLKTHSVVAIPRTQGALVPEKGNKKDFLSPLIFVVLLRLLFSGIFLSYQDKMVAELGILTASLYIPPQVLLM